jgi:hypothetical protein
LPQGSRRFTNITLNVPIAFPGSIQWNGHHVMTTPQAPTDNAIYQLKISNQSGPGSSEAAGTTISVVPR